jgi:hypothetical protein
LNMPRKAKTREDCGQIFNHHRIGQRDHLFAQSLL